VISRRDFLRLLGVNLAALAIPAPFALNSLQPGSDVRWPKIKLASLPDFPAEVLSITPRLKIDQAGYLMKLDGPGGKVHMPQAQTQWNLETMADYDRLLTRYPWVIVIHWFGNTENHQNTLDAFLRGFDGLRSIAGREQRTSAHFLVGRNIPSQAAASSVSVVQTQKPGPEGIPYLASHIYYLTSADLKERNYFLRALDELSWEQPGVHSGLQEIFSKPQIDPNYYTLAIEMDGYDFDNPDHFPPAQQTANLLGLLWALMERYQLPASAVVGHDEIDLRKGDPGKKFMATVRYLLGLKALVEGDPRMCQLVFGQYYAKGRNALDAIEGYFNFVQAYLARTATPKQVFEWETETNYWLVTDSLAGRSRDFQRTGRLFLPMGELFVSRGSAYLHPESHEGIDLYSNPDPADYLNPVDQAILLSFQGECLYTGLGGGCGIGPAAVFRHRTDSGAEFVSIYGHLSSIGKVTTGKFYPAGYPLGSVRGSGFADDGYLHLAFAYGATWEVSLNNRTSPPAGVSANWLRDRYLSPVEFLKTFDKM
jgi:hypothetical protein